MNAQPPRIAARNARNRQRDRALRAALTVTRGDTRVTIVANEGVTVEVCSAMYGRWTRVAWFISALDAERHLGEDWSDLPGLSADLYARRAEARRVGAS